MTQKPQHKNNTVLIVAIIGLVGTVITAIITVMGNYNIAKMNREIELTRIALIPSSAQNETTQVASTEIIAVTPTLDNLIPANSTETILPIPIGELLFSEDFEDGFSKGIAFNSGSWKVVDDGTGNKVLEQNSNTNSGDAVIGPPYIKNFSDGVIEFRFKTINGEMQLSFRLNSSNNGYTSYPLMYGLGGFQLLYQENGAWQPIEGTTINGSDQLFDNGWIILRVEAKKNNINIFANGNLVISAYDSRISEGRIDFGGSGNIQFDDLKVWDISQ